MLAAALSARGTPACARRPLPCLSSAEAYLGLIRSPQAALKTSLFFTFHSTGIRSVGLGSRKAKLFGTESAQGREGQGCVMSGVSDVKGV